MGGATIAIAVAGLLAAAGASAAPAPPDPAATPSAGPTVRQEEPREGPRPGWALVLSGGGARGLAHIGVLRLLEEEGLRPDAVFGTSMGALIGALYASGYSSAEIEARFVTIDWTGIFRPTSVAYEWRDIVLPRPWITLAGTGRALRLPPGIVDDANLDHELARALLDAEARARGDFSRLPIPFRAVATDAATLAAVTLDRGLLAQAVRASIAVPVVFPPVVMDGRLLVDGGTAATVPIVPAREAGFDTLLAVDVSRPQVPLTEHSSALEIGLSLLERIIKRGQPAELRPGEQLVWLDLPRISPADFTGSRAMIAWTIAHARDEVRSFAARLRGEAGPAPPEGSAASDTTPPAPEDPRRTRSVADSKAGHARRGRDFAPSAAPPVRLPPLRRLSWTLRDGSPARHERSAHALFGRAPRDSFAPIALGPGLERVHRGSLFTSAWPRFEVRHDSTDVAFVVTEQEPSELRIAGAWDDDREGRANAAWILRPAGPTPLRRLVIAGTVRRYGGLLFASAEPHALDRGAPGWFARAALQREKTRVFAAEDRWGTVTVDRLEGFLGRQLPLATGDVLQAGFGAGRVKVNGFTRAGPMGALRIESGGRLQRSLRCTGMLGRERYGSLAIGLGFEWPGYPVTLRPAVGLGLATSDTPPDEWPGLGGPESFGGLRRGEWLGRRRLAAELRAGATLVGVVRVHAAAQAGRVDDAIGRADLPERFRLAGVAGVDLDVPFGPLRIDWGMTEGGQSRWDVQLGQAF